MNRITVAGLSGVSALVVALIPALPASDADAGFPPVDGAPSWYYSAPAETYADGSMPLHPQTITDTPTQEKVTWWSPDGRAPSPDADGSRHPDITLANMIPLFNGVAPDPDVLVLSTTDALPDLAASLGTELTVGIALGGGATTPALRFPGHGLIIAQRPHVLCAVTDDPEQYTLDAAMLGANGQKYLIELDIQFGDRSAERAATCAGSGTSDVTPSTPSPVESPTPSPTETGRVGADYLPPQPTETPSQSAPSATPTAAATADDRAQTNGVLIAVVVIGLIVGALILLSRFRRPKLRFDNFGRPLDGSSSSSAPDSSRGRYGR